MVPRHRSAGPARSGPTTGKRSQRGAAPARAAHTTSSVRAAHAGPMRCLCASNRPTSAATKRACVSATCASLGASHCSTARRRARAQRPRAAHSAEPRSMQRTSGWHAPGAQQSTRTLQHMAGHIRDRSGRAAQARARGGRAAQDTPLGSTQAGRALAAGRRGAPGTGAPTSVRMACRRGSGRPHAPKNRPQHMRARRLAASLPQKPSSWLAPRW